MILAAYDLEGVAVVGKTLGLFVTGAFDDGNIVGLYETNDGGLVVTIEGATDIKLGETVGNSVGLAIGFPVGP